MRKFPVVYRDALKMLTKSETVGIEIVSSFADDDDDDESEE